MHSADERLFVLLDRYLAGEASAAEAQATRGWLTDDPEHAAILEDLRLIRRVAAERPPESGSDAAWAKAVQLLDLLRLPRPPARAPHLPTAW